MNVGADLWASDAALYADVMADGLVHARRRSRLRCGRAPSRGEGFGRAHARARTEAGVGAEDEDDGAVCPVCLGGTSARDGEDEGDGAEEGADHGVNPDVNSDDDDDGRDSLIAELPCGHRLHLRCALAAVDACVGAGDPPRCPTCRRVAAADGFLAS